MRNTLINIIAFAAGAAIGSAVTWKLVKTKYEQIAQEEIDSVKEVFANRQSEPIMGDTDTQVDTRTANDASEVFTSYSENLKQMGYTNYSEKAVCIEKKVDTAAEIALKPYVISPEEFAERKDYATVSLTYYADKVLTDDFDQIVEDVDDVVGLDSLSHFGEYEDDSVFVRNDETKTDYEILFDPRKFIDVANNRPHRAEDEWDETE